jgi:hypothetical protein
LGAVSVGECCCVSVYAFEEVVVYADAEGDAVFCHLFLGRFAGDLVGVIGGYVGLCGRLFGDLARIFLSFVP